MLELDKSTDFTNYHPLKYAENKPAGANRNRIAKALYSQKLTEKYVRFGFEKGSS
jgi:hypothetical protein